MFALAAAAVDRAFGGDREPFRQLINVIAAEPGRGVAHKRGASAK
jgi:hypothetical protein